MEKNYKPCEKLVLPCDREVKDRHGRETDREVKATEVKDRHGRDSESNRSKRANAKQCFAPRQNVSKIRFGYYG